MFWCFSMCVCVDCVQQTPLSVPQAGEPKDEEEEDEEEEGGGILWWLWETFLGSDPEVKRRPGAKLAWPPSCTLTAGSFCPWLAACLPGKQCHQLSLPFLFLRFLASCSSLPPKRLLLRNLLSLFCLVNLFSCLHIDCFFLRSSRGQCGAMF